MVRWLGKSPGATSVAPMYFQRIMTQSAAMRPLSFLTKFLRPLPGEMVRRWRKDLIALRQPAAGADKLTVGTPAAVSLGSGRAVDVISKRPRWLTPLLLLITRARRLALFANAAATSPGNGRTRFDNQLIGARGRLA